MLITWYGNKGVWGCGYMSHMYMMTVVMIEVQLILFFDEGQHAPDVTPQPSQTPQSLQ